eukprot:757151-Hanusia_phi.AAC.1
MAAAAVVGAMFPEMLMRKMLEEDIRLDERSFLHARDVSVNRGCFSSADGSAMVKVGRTVVAAGTNLSVICPSASRGGEGIVRVTVEFGPACSSRFQQFRYRKANLKALALSAYLTRIINEARVVDLTSLVVKEDAAVWVIDVNLTCLNHGGNLEDAAMLAALSALIDTKLPVLEMKDNETMAEVEGDPVPLVIRSFPISHTFALFDFGNLPVRVLLDPTDDEEEHCHALVTVILDVQRGADKDEEHSFFLNKAGGLPVNRKLLQRVISEARTRTEAILIKFFPEQGTVPMDSSK